MTLMGGSDKSQSPKRSSAAATNSPTASPSSTASASSSGGQNGISDSTGARATSPSVSKRKSGSLTAEAGPGTISATTGDRVDGGRSPSPSPLKTSAKSFRFSLPQNAGDLIGAPASEKPERSSAGRVGYDSDSRAQRKRSSSQLTNLAPLAVVSPTPSPKSKKRSSSVSSNPAAIVSESKQRRYDFVRLSAVFPVSSIWTTFRFRQRYRVGFSLHYKAFGISPNAKKFTPLFIC